MHDFNLFNDFKLDFILNMFLFRQFNIFSNVPLIFIIANILFYSSLSQPYPYHFDSIPHAVL